MVEDLRTKPPPFLFRIRNDQIMIWYITCNLFNQSHIKFKSITVKTSIRGSSSCLVKCTHKADVGLFRHCSKVPPEAFQLFWHRIMLWCNVFFGLATDKWLNSWLPFSLLLLLLLLAWIGRCSAESKHPKPKNLPISRSFIDNTVECKRYEAPALLITFIINCQTSNNKHKYTPLITSSRFCLRANQPTDPRQRLRLMRIASSFYKKSIKHGSSGLSVERRA